MNFYQIEFDSLELSNFFLKPDLKHIKQRPKSQFNNKKNMTIVYDDFHFYKKLKNVYGELWKAVKNPMITDTRYREDFLWLLRYYQLLSSPEGDDQNADEFNAMITDALCNANIYKENLETYVRLNIAQRVNVLKQKVNI
jgi:hypothetical protein